MSTFTIDTSTSRATPSPVPGKRTTAPSIRARKVDGKTEQPIVMLTAYTMRMAQLLDPHCDMLLVGDSLGQVIYGLPSTIPVTMDMMCAHGAAVVRGSWHALVGVDMPFGSYEGSPEQAFASASRIMKETGCAAVKLEGGEAMAETIGWCYLLTTSDEGQTRILAVRVDDLGGAMLRFGVGSKGTAANVAARSQVTLLFPPREAEGMSLIVDGTATVEGGVVSFVARSAVKHRSALRV